MADKGHHTLMDVLQAGAAAHRAGRLAEAEHHYQAVLSANPGQADALNLLGAVRQQQGQSVEAEKLIRRALSGAPDNPAVHINLGTVLVALGKPDQAERHYKKAVKLAPDNAEAHYNLGIALLERGRFADSLAHFTAAATHQKGHIPAIWHISMVSLLLGDFKTGFDLYEARWQANPAQGAPRPFPQPVWDGGRIESGTLLLWGEQGVGDEVMFANLLPDAMAAAPACLVECDARLQPLFERSFPGIRTVARTDPPAPATQGGDIVAHLPTGSLARFFRSTAASFPTHPGYLKADTDKVAALRAQYKEHGDGPLVGLAWKSGNVARGAQRTIGLDQWGAVLNNKAVFINLQYGDTAADIAAAQDVCGAVVHTDPAVDQMKSLDDFAAQVAALDLVITIDNSAAHMAGALGVPTWVMLPLLPDCRWGGAGDDCLWYPNARLIRQTAAGDWKDVLAQAGRMLEDAVNGAPTT